MACGGMLATVARCHMRGRNEYGARAPCRSPVCRAPDDQCLQQGSSHFSKRAGRESQYRRASWALRRRQHSCPCSCASWLSCEGRSARALAVQQWRDVSNYRGVQVHNPRLESVAAEAAGDAEALVADLTSPIRLRRRGAKSALGWMAEEDTATASPSPRSFDTYDEAVVAATEWDVAAEVAMTRDMLEVLKHLAKMGKECLRPLIPMLLLSMHWRIAVTHRTRPTLKDCAGMMRRSLATLPPPCAARVSRMLHWQ